MSTQQPIISFSCQKSMWNCYASVSVRLCALSPPPLQSHFPLGQSWAGLDQVLLSISELEDAHTAEASGTDLKEKINQCRHLHLVFPLEWSDSYTCFPSPCPSRCVCLYNANLRGLSSTINFFSKPWMTCPVVVRELMWSLITQLHGR